MDDFVCRVRFVAAAVFLLVAAMQLPSQALQPGSEPLPDPAALLQAASEKEDTYAIERQKYLCVFKNTKFATHTVRLYESFYINGHEIQRILSVNDVPLSPEQKQAEEARVNAEIKRCETKPAVPFVGLAGGMWISSGEHRWSETVEGAIVRAAIFKNQRRVTYRDRPAIQIDFEGNPRFKPHTPEESIARAMTGTIIVDEESGAIVRVGAQATADVFHNGELMVVHGAQIGFDATQITEDLWLPSSWVSFRMVTNQPTMPHFYPDTEDFWLQSCREYTSEAHMLPGVVPVQ